LSFLFSNPSAGSLRFISLISLFTLLSPFQLAPVLYEMVVIHEISKPPQNLARENICPECETEIIIEQDQNRNSSESLIKNLDLCRSFEIIRWISGYFHFSGFLQWMINERSINWVRSLYFCLLIESSLAERHRVDKWSRAKFIEDDFRKLALCLSCSSLNKSLSDSLPLSNSSTNACKVFHVL
jgi:hypothetical protein